MEDFKPDRILFFCCCCFLKNIVRQNQLPESDNIYPFCCCCFPKMKPKTVVLIVGKKNIFAEHQSGFKHLIQHLEIVFFKVKDENI